MDIAQFVSAVLGAAALGLGQLIVPTVKGWITGRMDKKANRERETFRLKRLLRNALELMYRARKVALEHGSEPDEIGEIPDELERWEESDG